MTRLTLTAAALAVLAHGATASAQYTIKRLGLIGTEYQYTTTGGAQFRSTQYEDLNDAGQVLGSSARYTSTGGQLGMDGWIYDGTAVRQVGLLGTGYEYTSTSSGTGTYRYTKLAALNSRGQAVGTSDRYRDATYTLGSDAWYFNGTSTVQIGLTGSGYEYSSMFTGGNIRRDTVVAGLNDAGRAIGNSNRYTANGSDIGADAWISNGSATVRIGLSGTGYQYNYGGSSTDIRRENSVQQINAAGQASGYVYRFTSTGNDLGNDAWFFNGSTALVAGLTGTGYEYVIPGGGGNYRFSRPQQLSASGQMSGTTARYSSTGTAIGQDAWVYTGGSTKLIGLTGTNYEYANTGSGGGTFRAAQPLHMNDAGQIIGRTFRYNSAGGSIGEDAWIYNGSTTQLIGLTGSPYEYTSAGGGTVRLGSASVINAAGKVIGGTTRWNSAGNALGQDAWVYNGTSTVAIGLSGAGYIYTYAGTGGGSVRVGVAQTINDAGSVIGRTNRYSSTGTNAGQDAWLYNGTLTRQVGLTGPGYEYVDSTGTVNRASGAGGLNAAGQACGYSRRYDSTGTTLGLDSWFYDPATNVTTPLSFGVDPRTNMGQTYTNILTDNGFVLGGYEVYADGKDLGSRAYAWSLADGFHDLGSMVNGGLTAAQWSRLSSIYAAMGSAANGLPESIVGGGLVADGNIGNDVYLLTYATPEPTALLLTGAAIAPVLARRRRRR